MTGWIDGAVRVDCRLYRGSEPCEPHKLDGRQCPGCSAYQPAGHRILVIKLGALGDVLRATALLPSIKEQFPGAHITWLTGDSARTLLEGNLLVDRVLTIGSHYLEVLLTERFDAGFCLDNDPLAAAAARIARCDVLRGFVVNDHGAVVPASNSARTWWRLGIDDALKRQNRRTWFDLMTEMCGLPPVTSPPQLAIRPLARDVARQRLSLWRTRPMPLVGLNTGGGNRWAHKKWTFSGYVGFVRELRQVLRLSQVVLLGGPEERALNRSILAEVRDLAIDGGCHDDVHEFAALVEGMDILVTSDSLGLHVATAVRTPAVVLVGPTSASELDLFGRGEILSGDVECLACYQRRCDKLVTCMDRLETHAVVEATLRQLRSCGGAAREPETADLLPGGPVRRS